MKGYIENIEKVAEGNDAFRQVLYTGSYLQLVVMSIPVGEDIGMETHGVDQFIRIEQGTGIAMLDGEEHDITAGFAVVIPAGTEHNFINTGSEDLKLYTVYAPPHHKDGVMHATKSEAESAHEEFLGDTTE